MSVEKLMYLISSNYLTSSKIFSSTATLNRSLVLLNALGETFKLCFPENTDIIAILGLNDLDKLLEVITRQYLDTQAETGNER